MSAQDTPGPWYYGGKHDECEVRYVKSDAPGYPVEVATLFHSDGAEQEASARLIAAAPDLLEALNDLLEAVDSMRGTYGCIQGRHPEEDDTHIHDKWAEALLDERATLARAAIAKATGSAT